MAINRLASDMYKIGEIMGCNISNLDISNIGIETYLDMNDDNKGRIPMEVVFDKQRDPEYQRIEGQLSKIFNAFMYGECSGFWRKVVLEGFEPSTQVDFMLLISFIYMRKADIDNKEVRIAETMSTVAAILCKYIK